MKEQRFISTSEAAKRLGVGLHAVRRLVERSKINGEHIGRNVLIADDEALKKQVAARNDVRKKLGQSETEAHISLGGIYEILMRIDKRLSVLEERLIKK